MNRYEFPLCILPEQYLDYYRGTVRQVIVRCASGQTVQFPASLRPIRQPGGNPRKVYANLRRVASESAVGTAALRE